MIQIKRSIVLTYCIGFDYKMTLEENKKYYETTLDACFSFCDYCACAGVTTGIESIESVSRK